MKFAPFKPYTLSKHVRVEILHREFPVKNLYFPSKGLQCRALGIYNFAMGKEGHRSGTLNSCFAAY